MKLSMFLVLLPSVSAFVVTPATLLKQPPHHNRDSFRTAPPAAASSAGERRGSSSSSRMSMGPQQPRGEEGAWSITSFWREVMGTASETKAKVDSTAADAYAELKKKVLVKKERQSLEGQLTSLIRIEGNTMSCKAEDCVRRLASELEALQDNAAEFGSARTGLAGRWKLIYSSACCGDGKSNKGGADRLTSIEDISYVSENYRLSHSDDGVLRVYRRVSPRPVRDPAAAAAAAAAAAGDDTSGALVGSGSGRSSGGKNKSAAGRGSAAAARGLRAGARQPLLRKRMFWGWLRR